MQRGPVPREVVCGHRIPATRADLEDVDHNDGPRAGDDLDALGRQQLVERGCAVLQHGALAVDAQDARRAFKRVQHDGDASVTRLVQVAGRLDPRAGEIHVPEFADDGFLRVWVVAGFLDHAEEGSAFVRDALWGHVDATVAREGRRCDVQEFLREDPFYQ